MARTCSDECDCCGDCYDDGCCGFCGSEGCDGSGYNCPDDHYQDYNITDIVDTVCDVCEAADPVGDARGWPGV